MKQNKICILLGFCKKIKAVNNMKKHIFIITCIVVLTTIINVSAINDAENLKNSKNIVASENTVNRYILKDYNGQIALFSEESEKPIEVYNIFTLSLPQKDIGIIKKGILVTESELKAILEEYTS